MKLVTDLLIAIASFVGARIWMSVMTALLLIVTGNVNGATYYVSATSLNNGPGTNWDTAYHDIQNAVTDATYGDVVLVTNGTYNSGGAVRPGGSLVSRIMVTKAITIQSVGGPTGTIILGQGPVSDAAVSCAFLGNGAVISGFTLSNGFTRATGLMFKDQGGGGAYALGAIITNCIIAGNEANAFGGGVCYGSVVGSIISDNSAMNGGGTAYTFSDQCLISANFSYSSGGGVYSGKVVNCAIDGNIALGDAGGLYYSSSTNCNIVGNYAGGNGGGVCGGSVNNAKIFANNATEGGDGGGAYSAILTSCAVVENAATGRGGGAFGCELYNSIVYYNTAITEGENWYGLVYVWNSCTTPSPAPWPFYPGDKFPNFVNNTTDEPQFVNWVAGDLHLSTNSPCIQAGGISDYFSHPSPPLTSLDLDGNPRIQGGVVDMGAYETPYFFINAQARTEVIAMGWLMDGWGAYTTYAEAGAMGSISPSGKIMVTSHSNQTFIFSPGTYCFVTNLSVDGELVEGASSYTFSNLVSEHSIAANFSSYTPRWWLENYGITNFTVDTSFEDVDHDGMANWQEWVAGCDPTDPTSVFKLTHMGDTSGQGVIIRWPSISNRFYDLSRATNLLGTLPFTVLSGASNIPATPPENVYTDSGQGVGPYFYKVSVHE